MGFIRLPDDYEPAEVCATCDEHVLLSEAARHDGEYFHPDCRSDLARCDWCGEWLYRTEARQIGKEFYHPVCFAEMEA